MSRNESRNEAVYIVSVSMTLKTLINQQLSSPRKTKPLVTAEFSDGPQDFWPLVFSSLRPGYSNTNQPPVVKKLCRCHLGSKSDRGLSGWSWANYISPWNLDLEVRNRRSEVGEGFNQKEIFHCWLWGQKGQVARNVSLGTESGPSAQPARKQGQELTSRETELCVSLNELGQEPRAPCESSACRTPWLTFWEPEQGVMLLPEAWPPEAVR